MSKMVIFLQIATLFLQVIVLNYSFVKIAYFFILYSKSRRGISYRCHAQRQLYLMCNSMFHVLYIQIQSLYGNKERLSMSKEIIMKPLEQYPVHVLFAPTKVNSREGKLVIRVVNTSTKYTVSRC